jgi:hypothetical protein
LHQHLGQGIEKDEKKEMFHMEEATIGGHPFPRHNLGCHEGSNGRIERAIKHYIIAANLGHDDAIDKLRKGYAEGSISQDVFAAAFRLHQTAVDATKSPQGRHQKNVVETGTTSMLMLKIVEVISSYSKVNQEVEMYHTHTLYSSFALLKNNTNNLKALLENYFLYLDKYTSLSCFFGSRKPQW